MFKEEQFASRDSPDVKIHDFNRMDALQKKILHTLINNMIARCGPCKVVQGNHALY